MTDSNKKNKKLFFTYPGIGDALLLSGVMDNIYKKTGEKQLVASNHKTLFENNPNIEFIDLKLSAKKIKNLTKNLYKKGIDLIYLDYYKCLKTESFPRLIYPDKHIIAEMSEKAGYFGEIDIKPSIYLTNDEKKFGRFFEKNQIAVMSEADSIYKNWGFDNMQQLVNKLKDKYNFVQVGPFKNRLLDGVLDKRGILNLREVASVLYNSDIFVGQIGGLMHLARAVNCRSVISYSGHEPIYFDSYILNINVLPDITCDLCQTNKIQPYRSTEERENCPNQYVCINSISVDKMIEGIELQMSKLGQALEVEKVYLNKTENIATSDSFFNSYELLSNIKNKIYLFDKILIFSILNYKNIKIKYCLFDFLVLLKIKKFNKFKNIKVYLFSFILFLHIKKLEKYSLVLLFNIIPIFKIS